MPLWQFFDDFKTNQMNGTLPFDFDDDVIKVALFNATAAPIVTMTVLDDLVGSNEVVNGNGYTTGGELMANMTVAEAAGVVTVDNTLDITWSFNASGFANARFVILYEDTGNETTSNMVAFMDMSTDKGNTTGDLTLAFDALGLFTLSG